MKKVVLSLALVAMMSVSFVSCKEKAAEGDAAAADTTVVVEPTAEPVAPAADTTATAPAVDTTAATPAAAPAH